MKKILCYIISLCLCFFWGIKYVNTENPFKSSKLKIFVFYHSNVELPDEVFSSDIYQPVHLGSRNGDRYANNAKVLYDDTSQNISYKNFTYSEYSGLYWVWKNIDISQFDYIGIAHYRRLISEDNITKISDDVY